ncbi:EAL domain-containing protein [Petrocella sp. FN5]|uniref:EAL domain-containing protein n=1 Tax=Petrocella sp. FN5 TaxID=3032002 RepID=UPI0023DA6DD4|nr:EAL domain-containing protein [Petrocella sp. FN5]MDF1617732.1 EAL domain-containing protein [Petrocella sp. FN5]
MLILKRFIKCAYKRLVILSLLLLIGVTLPVSANEIVGNKAINILVLHTYHQGMSSNDTLNRQIEAAIEDYSMDDVQLHVEYLDDSRFDIINYDVAFINYLKAKYNNKSIDGILSINKGASNFVENYHEELFNGLPIVYIGLGSEAYAYNASDRVSGIYQEIPWASLMLSAKKLNPDLKKINIYTKPELIFEKTLLELKDHGEENNLLFKIFSKNQGHQYVNDLLDMNPDEAAILVSDMDDISGYVFTLEDIFESIDLSGNGSVYTIYESYVGRGAVGAITIEQNQYIGKSVGMLMELVKGNDLDLSSYQELKPIEIYDYTKIKKHNLEYKNLSENVRFINRPTVLDIIQNNPLEFIILALVIMMVVLTYAITNLLLRLKAEKDRKLARKDLQASYMELEATHQQLLASESEVTRKYVELQEKEEELRKSRERYRLAAKGSEFGIWDYDFETRKMYFSNQAKDIFGLSADQNSFVSSEIFSCLPSNEAIKLYKKIKKHLNVEDNNVIEYEAIIEIEKGKKEWISIRGKAQYDDQGKPLRLAGSLTNITKEKETELKIKNLAFTDELTNLPNKTYYNQVVSETCQDKNSKLAMYFIDIDNFKTINDFYGHKMGDRVLKKVASMIRHEVDERFEVIRYGGDEFIVLLKDFIAIEEVEAQAQKLLKTFQNKFVIEDSIFSVTLSLGIATTLDKTVDFDLLLKQADLALHEAKGKGKNQYHHYTKTLMEKMEQQLWFEKELEIATLNNQFKLYYQPKYDLKEEIIVGYEALIRWMHPEKGIIPPNDFIPLSEENGLIIAIGKWVIYEAISQLNQWHLKGHTRLTMSINLSAKQFVDVNLIETIQDAMKGKVIRPEHVELEITETTALQDLGYATNILKDLRSQGYKISLDDFGTGYSSLNYLNELPIDILKIDKAFISDSMHSKSKQQVIKTIIQLAHVNKMDVVAEGVESYEEMELLRTEKCDMIQGYLLSKPIPPNEAIELMNKYFEIIKW